jgi:[CysO sulfur-carrier protein]-S-L-cysteine hydrolase
MLTELRLPDAMREEIVAHARQEVPRECCGVIIGPPGELAELRRMTNTWEGDDFYDVDGGELLALLKELDEREWELTAIYHSHPVSPARPSPRDIEYAGYPDSVYIICSLEHPDTPDLRAFTIVDEQVTEVTIIPA